MESPECPISGIPVKNYNFKKSLGYLASALQGLLSTKRIIDTISTKVHSSHHMSNLAYHPIVHDIVHDYISKKTVDLRNLNYNLSIANPNFILGKMADSFEALSALLNCLNVEYRGAMNTTDASPICRLFLTKMITKCNRNMLLFIR